MSQAGDAAQPAAAQPQKLIAESYTPPNPGPYPQDKPPENQVRFTPVQVGSLFMYSFSPPPVDRPATVLGAPHAQSHDTLQVQACLLPQ
jgi:hypothetical protein